MIIRPTSAVAIAVACLAIGCAQELPPEVTAQIRQLTAAGEGDRGVALRQFYEQRGYAPVWIGRSPAGDAVEALRVIRTAPNHGFDVADYNEVALAQLIEGEERTEEALKDDPNALAQFDVRLTASLLTLGRDVAIGRTTPGVLSSLWKPQRKSPDLPGTLSAAIGGKLGTWLDTVRPRHPEYAALQQTLTNINERQRAQGTPDTRAGQIALNMERWRWLPDDLGARHLLVNVPAFYMAAREGGKPVLEMKVIVGKPEHATPIFSDVMETVVFSPYWNVPDSIAEGETAPSAARDPDFLRRNNIEILRRSGDGATTVDPDSVDWEDPDSIKELAFRQKPGAKNALGHVKFLFPNSHDVYLHDTPADALFFREGRAFSHGCIRLEHPEELAKYVLRDKPEWDEPKMKAAMYAGVEKHVALGEKLPIHIVYFTAWPKGDGDVDVFEDIYGYDRKQKGR
jgi:murein L,D-transpeptidase YcbB/YkuD